MSGEPCKHQIIEFNQSTGMHVCIDCQSDFNLHSGDEQDSENGFVIEDDKAVFPALLSLARQIKKPHLISVFLVISVCLAIFFILMNWSKIDHFISKIPNHFPKTEIVEKIIEKPVEIIKEVPVEKQIIKYIDRPIYKTVEKPIYVQKPCNCEEDLFRDNFHDQMDIDTYSLEDD